MQGFTGLPLHTPRLLLRPLAEADVPALHAIHADAEAMRYWDGTVWTSDARGRAMVARDAAATGREYLRLGIVPQPGNGPLIGTCALWRIDAQSRRAEIGYILAREQWGRGLAHEALSALIDHAFTVLDLNRLEADTDPRNVRSTALLQHLGFVQEGLFRERCIVDGEVSDSAMFGLLRREWRPAGAPPARADDALSPPPAAPGR
jgi:RimJ/RimL family protein N-acetyltransferase